MGSDATIIWDFDGTLGRRSRLMAGAMMDALEGLARGHGLCEDDLRPLLLECFPWAHPERPHPELNEPTVWWQYIEGVLAEVYVQLGIEKRLAKDLARNAHARYVDPNSFMLFDDALPIVQRLHEDGWRQVLLSNHVPELDSIVQSLGLGRFIDPCFTSARIGYEKPHPESFRTVLEAIGQPEEIWVIGDNVEADIHGAEALGLPAILVRGPQGAHVKYKAATLFEVPPILEEAGLL